MLSERQDAAAYAEIVARSSPEVRELATRARALVLDVMPRAFEVVWSGQGIAGYGTGPRKMSEHFCWISPQRAHVNLGFNYGAELPDPEHLLEGTGRLFRHVKLRSVDDVNRSALRQLVEAASRHRVPPLQDDR